MKRNAFFLLASLVVLTSTTGCGCCSWLWPKAPIAAQPTYTQYAPACDTCNQCCDPCDSCGTSYGANYGANYGGDGAYGLPSEYGSTYGMPGPGGY
jgi:hypothetical protein